MAEALNRLIAWIARNVKKVIGMVILVVLMAIVFTTAFGKGYHFMRSDSYAADSNNGKVITIEVPENTTVDSIAQMLVDKGVLSDTFEFKLKAKLAGASDFKFGIYYIQENAKVDDIIKTLKAGDQSDVATVSVSKGMTIDDLADQLETLGVCTGSYFRKACNNTSYDMPIIREIEITSDRRYALEGYLMPGTYRIIKDSASASVVKVFLEEFGANYSSVLKQMVDESGYTLDEVIIMASIVEAECAVAADYPIFASMLLNRLNSSDEQLQYLNMPSTILYAQMRSSDELTSVTEADQTYESAYNTYLHALLPPGPICNPSIEAIKAVLYPEDTDYYFYEIDLENRSGTRHFSKTTSEHQAYLDAQQ